jgi:hypothetical protein
MVATVDQVFEEHIQPRTRDERLVLLALIADSLTTRPHKGYDSLSRRLRHRRRHSVLDVLAKTPGQRLFRTAEEVDSYLSRERESWDS